jgi:hypothetical protein
MNGIIFFEDGQVQIFGTLSTVKNIARAINETLPQLVKQERQQMLNSITDDEFRYLVDQHTTQKTEDDT